MVVSVLYDLDSVEQHRTVVLLNVPLSGLSDVSLRLNPGCAFLTRVLEM